MRFDPSDPAPAPSESREAADIPVSEYWRKTRRLTRQLMSVWFALTFGSIFFARELMALRFFGWPLSFYMVAQGVVLLYTAIIALYAYRMKRLDQHFKRGNANVD